MHLRSVLISNSKQMNLDVSDYLKKNHFPASSDVDFVEELINDRATHLGSSDIVVRCRSGCKLIRDMIDLNVPFADLTTLQRFLGEKHYDTINRELITNSHRTDLHFLPKDDEDPQWSAIPAHSLVLFRYPQTAPIEVFDLAQDINIREWTLIVDELSLRLPYAKSFRANKPLKVLKLRAEFLSDLLTRFVGLYVRLGSPDFTKETVDEFLAQIGD
jgi:hypothetical protein